MFPLMRSRITFINCLLVNYRSARVESSRLYAYAVQRQPLKIFNQKGEDVDKNHEINVKPKKDNRRLIEKSMRIYNDQLETKDQKIIHWDATLKFTPINARHVEFL